MYLNEIIDGKTTYCQRAVLGLFPAVSEVMMLRFFADDSKEVATVFRFLRNQEQKEKGVPNLSLSDYIAPENYRIDRLYRRFCRDC